MEDSAHLLWPGRVAPIPCYVCRPTAQFKAGGRYATTIRIAVGYAAPD